MVSKRYLLKQGGAYQILPKRLRCFDYLTEAKITDVLLLRASAGDVSFVQYQQGKGDARKCVCGTYFSTLCYVKHVFADAISKLL
jgi:hypothetical protein